MNKELPIYKLVIKDDDKSGVDFIAMVDKPAIEMTWQMFENKKQLFKVDSDRQIISGALMVADLPIYRRDDQKGEYYVVFDAPMIEKIQHKFMANGFTKNFNMMHNPNEVTRVATLFNSFIIDSKMGIKTPEGYDELTDGSWFGSVKISDTEFWNQFIKTGKFQGFSVEGFFETVYEKTEPKKDIIQQIKDILSVTSKK
jgi:hypothetical protein